MKKNILLLLVIGSIISLFLTTCSRKKDYPNIIIILADDLGYGDPGCYNPESKIPTPNIDRLASGGMIFTDAHTPSTVCSPTRYALLTGRYAWREPRLQRGVLGKNDKPVIEPERMTLANMLGEKGYLTAAIGKWHLGLEWHLIDTAMPVSVKNVDWSKPQVSGMKEQGFDYSFSLGMPGWTFSENNMVLSAPTEHFDLNNIGPYLIGPNNIEGYKSPDYQHEKMLPTFTEKALDFISSASEKGRPFFLYFSPMCPHKPVVPNKAFIGKSEAGLYGDFVNEFDYSVGLILDELEKSDISGNTLVFLTSDNGPENTAYDRISISGHYSMDGFRGVKRDLWEGGHRVPFIVRWPGEVKASSSNDATICLVDIMATVADITGSEIKPGNAEDSYSFLTVIADNSTAIHKRDPVVHHSNRNHLAIRKGQWVYIDAHSGDMNKEPAWFREQLGVKTHDDEYELFNLSDDPKQTRNVYEVFPGISKELKDDLEIIKAIGSVKSR